VQDFFGGLTAPLYTGSPKKVFDNRNQSDHLVHRLSALRRTQTTLRTSIISPFIEAYWHPPQKSLHSTLCPLQERTPSTIDGCLGIYLGMYRLTLTRKKDRKVSPATLFTCMYGITLPKGLDCSIRRYSRAGLLNMSPCGRGFGVSWGPQSGLTNASPAITIMEFLSSFLRVRR
jgi:hypothetical protein